MAPFQLFRYRTIVIVCVVRRSFGKKGDNMDNMLHCANCIAHKDVYNRPGTVRRHIIWRQSKIWPTLYTASPLTENTSCLPWSTIQRNRRRSVMWQQQQQQRRRRRRGRRRRWASSTYDILQENTTCLPSSPRVFVIHCLFTVSFLTSAYSCNFSILKNLIWKYRTGSDICLEVQWNITS